MNETPFPDAPAAEDYREPVESVAYDFGVSRRAFVHVLGAGLMLAVGGGTARLTLASFSGTIYLRRGGSAGRKEEQ